MVNLKKLEKKLMSIKVKRISDDFWGRARYQDIKTKQIFADVDGRLHTVTKSIGEPCCPLRKDLKIVKLK